MMALYEKEHYKELITSAHTAVMGFGGTFLMMVFFRFFLDINKDSHWLHLIEDPMTRLGKNQAIEAAIVIGIMLGVSSVLPEEHDRLTFQTASAIGMILYILVDGLTAFFQDDSATATLAKQGFMGFLYLEVLDTAFSFDGVIGAFALTPDLLLITIGLSIGSFYVRSITKLMVDNGTLNEFEFLEHGAFWAIGTLSSIMFINTFTEVSELVTGSVGAILIILSVISSIRYRQRKEERNEKLMDPSPNDDTAIISYVEARVVQASTAYRVDGCVTGRISMAKPNITEVENTAKKLNSPGISMYEKD
jgi:hypothetical protein